MLIVALALVVVAATAAGVIRDANPRPAKPAPAPGVEPPVQPLVVEPATQGIAMTGPPEAADEDVDAPTQSMPAVAFAGGQGAAALPYSVVPSSVPSAGPLA